MNISYHLLSTRQVSSLLSVHESSVKRWCNVGQLECRQTQGGHRRIRIESVLSFARAKQISFPLLEFNEFTGRVWTGYERARQTGNFSDLVALAYYWMNEARNDLPGRLIMFLESSGFVLATVLDQLIAGVMKRIGVNYLNGDLSIGDEHQMTQVIRDTLVGLHVDLIKSNPSSSEKKRPVAVVGCLRNVVHELGALMVRLVLEAKGWRVVYLGQDVPTEEYAEQQRKQKATLVCISVIPPQGIAEVKHVGHLLRDMYDPYFPYRLAFGGPELTGNKEDNETSKMMPVVRFFSGMEDFSKWIDV